MTSPRSSVDISNLTRPTLNFWYSPQNWIFWKSSYLSKWQFHPSSRSGHKQTLMSPFFLTTHIQFISRSCQLSLKFCQNPPFTHLHSHPNPSHHNLLPVIFNDLCFHPYSPPSLWSIHYKAAERTTHNHKSDDVIPILKTINGFPSHSE